VGESRGAYRGLVGKPKGKKWDEVGMDLIAMAQNRNRWRGLVNAWNFDCLRTRLLPKKDSASWSYLINVNILVKHL
jgi:hypothetical protein